MSNERRNDNPGRRAEDLYARWNVRVRDSVIFVVGVVGVVNELFIVATPRPSILLFLGSLIGVPFVMSADERRNVLRDRQKDE